MSYQIDDRNLATIRREIKDQILAKLEEARLTTLQDVQKIVYGNRTDAGNTENMPIVWILPVPHRPDQKGGHTSIHDFTFDIVVMIHEIDEPETGGDQAENLCSRVYDVLIKDRTLNGKVFDVIPLSFDPSFESEANSTVFWSSCEFAFRIQRRE